MIVERLDVEELVGIGMQLDYVWDQVMRKGKGGHEKLFVCRICEED